MTKPSIRAFFLRGFKPFLYGAVVPLRPLTLLFGENSTGKSSIIQALFLTQHVLGHEGRAEAKVLQALCDAPLGEPDYFQSRSDFQFQERRPEPGRVTTGFWLHQPRRRPKWADRASWDRLLRHWNHSAETPAEDGAGPDGSWLLLEIGRADRDPGRAPVELLALEWVTPLLKARFEREDSGLFRLAESAFRQELPAPVLAAFEDVDPEASLGAGALALHPGAVGFRYEADSGSSREKQDLFLDWFHNLVDQFSAGLGSLLADPVHLGSRRRLPAALGGGAELPSPGERAAWDLLEQDPGGAMLDRVNGQLKGLGIPYQFFRGLAATTRELWEWTRAWEDANFPGEGEDHFEKILDGYFPEQGEQQISVSRLESILEARQAHFKRRKPALSQSVAETLDWAIGLWEHLVATVRARGETRLFLVDQTSRTQVDFGNVGSGLLSLVPILLLALAPGPRLLVVEEPELHLHPRLQASVGDILAGVARRPGSCCIVETHSEHVLLRILRRIRETTEDDPGLAGNLRLACQDLAIACVHRQPEATIRIYLQPDAPVLVPNSDGQSKVRPILAGPDGRILSEDWPDGFLTERIREMKIDPLMNGAME